MSVIGGATTLDEIAIALGMSVPKSPGRFSEKDWYGSRRFQIALKAKLDELERVGYLARDGRGRYSVTEQWDNARVVLGTSLTAMAQLSGERAMVVHPNFDHRAHLAKALNLNHDIFVIMPYNPRLKPLMDVLREVGARYGLVVKRADELSGKRLIEDIWEAIVGAKAIVADCTDCNPNVLYEIGIADTVGRPVVLLTQNTEELPSDLQGRRFLPYDLSESGREELATRLGEIIDGWQRLPEE